MTDIVPEKPTEVARPKINISMDKRKRILLGSAAFIYTMVMLYMQYKLSMKGSSIVDIPKQSMYIGGFLWALYGGVEVIEILKKAREALI